MFPSVFTEYLVVWIFWFHTEIAPCSWMFIFVKLQGKKKIDLLSQTIKSYIFLIHFLTSTGFETLKALQRCLRQLKVWNICTSLLREIVQVSLLEVFKTWLNTAPNNLVWPLGWPCFAQEVGLETSWVPSSLRFYNPVTFSFCKKRWTL